MHLTNGIRCLVEHGETVTIDPGDPSQMAAARFFALSAGVGTLLHQRKYLPLHCAAIETPGGCVAFAGNAGDGKSTLAASFSGAGFKLFTDDRLTLHARPDAPYLASKSRPCHCTHAGHRCHDAVAPRHVPRPPCRVAGAGAGLSALGRGPVPVDQHILAATPARQVASWRMHGLDHRPRSRQVLFMSSSQISDSTVLIRTSQLPAAELGPQDTVLLDAEKGVYYGLEGPARVIWDMLENECTRGRHLQLAARALRHRCSHLHARHHGVP
jgi:hypothetical protein